MAVAKALGARRILAIDVNASRLEFAKQYVGAETHLAIPMNPGEAREDYSKRHVSLMVPFDMTGLTGCRANTLWRSLVSGSVG
jgi:threonine dehydrogenase-like Zn-dependent dehydrogenase